jgi:hypothetical protein
MKSTSFTFCFLIIGILSIAQSNVYHPFPTSNAIWREHLGDYQCSCKNFQYYIAGDTIISGLRYQEIRQSGANLVENPQGFCTFQIYNYFNLYVGAYRNDSVNMKVFMIPADSLNEHLLYDFDLKLNDPLPPSLLGNSAGEYYVTVIDSILIGNEYRRRIIYSQDTLFAYYWGCFIEGMGSEYGLLGNNGSLSMPFECGTTLLCFKQNNQTVYPDTNYTCNLVVTNIEYPAGKARFIVSPMPVKDHLKIIFQEDKNVWDARLMNEYGVELKRIKNIQSSDIIDLKEFPDGLYFLIFSNNGEIVYRTKVIKAN